jgi:hypothetical protein
MDLYEQDAEWVLIEETWWKVCQCYWIDFDTGARTARQATHSDTCTYLDYLNRYRRKSTDRLLEMGGITPPHEPLIRPTDETVVHQRGS